MSLQYKAVVVGVSAGGMNALSTIVPALPSSFPLPVAIVQHTSETSDNFLAEYLNRMSAITVKEAEDKELFLTGCVYLSPPGYHLLVEPDKTFSLSVDAKVQYSCPSIDVLFESAADVFEASLIGIILTGANEDGAQGLQAIKAAGGLAIVQNPETAAMSTMPKAALKRIAPDYVLNLEQIAPLLLQLCNLQ